MLNFASFEELDGHVVYWCGPDGDEIGYSFSIPTSNGNNMRIDISRDELRFMLHEVEAWAFDTIYEEGGKP